MHKNIEQTWNFKSKRFIVKRLTIFVICIYPLAKKRIQNIFLYTEKRGSRKNKFFFHYLYFYKKKRKADNGYILITRIFVCLIIIYIYIFIVKSIHVCIIFLTGCIQMLELPSVEI